MVKMNMLERNPHVGNPRGGLGEKSCAPAMSRYLSRFRKIQAILSAVTITAFSCWAEPVSSNMVVRAVNTLIAQNGQMGCPIEGPVSSVRLCTATNGAAFYVAKLAGGGFVVTSTDTEIDPIIAISPAPDLVEDPQNPLWALLVRDMAARQEPLSAGGKAKSRLMASAAPGKPSTSAAAARWARLTSSKARLMSNGRTTISDVRVEPLLKTKWGQSNVGGTPCFNYYTPRNYVCGCEATAIAQVFRYHKFPTAAIKPRRYRAILEPDRVWIDEEYDPYDDDDDEEDDPDPDEEYKTVLSQIGGYYDWDNMPYVPADGITTDQRKAVGKLTYDISLALESTFTRDLTDARLDRFVDLFKEWGYSGAKYCNLSDYWCWESDDYYSYGSYYDGWTLDYYYDDEYDDQLKSVIIPNLDAKLPVVVCMYGWSRSGKYIGHVVVADGYGYLGGEQLCVHLNLGWNGDANAWYVLPGIVGDATYKYVGDSYLWYNIYPHGPKWAGIASGRVLSASARTPISGIAVTASNQVGKVLRTTTDAKGIYAFILPSASDPEYWPDGVDPDEADWLENRDWVISLEGASPGIYEGEIWDDKNYYGLDFSLQDPSRLRILTFDANGGSVSPSAWSTPSGSPVGVLPTPTRLGHSCVGWYTAREGGVCVTPETLMVPYNVTLYAHWTVNSYKISLDAGGGSVSHGEVSAAYGSAVGALPTPKWAGHAFAGWYTAPEGGVRVTPETLMVPYDVTLYAHWEGVVTGSSADHPIPFAFGASIVAYPVSLTRELQEDMSYDYGSGVLFCRSAVARGKVYTLALPAGQAFEVSCDAPAGKVDYVTLGGLRYGRVDVRDIPAGTANVLLRISGGVGARTTVYVVEGDYLAKRLLFDANGGSCPVASKEVRARSPVGELPTPARGGFAFDGWFTAPEGGVRVTPETTMVNFDVTLYAHWEAVAAGSCREKAIPFPFGPSVAAYPVTLAKEWLAGEGRYDETSGVLYCRSSVARGKVYTLALPIGQKFTVSCEDAGAIVEYATSGTLRLCLVDARDISEETAELDLKLSGGAGSGTTVYAAEGNLVPAGADYEDPDPGDLPGSCPGKATGLEFADGARTTRTQTLETFPARAPARLLASNSRTARAPGRYASCASGTRSGIAFSTAASATSGRQRLLTGG